MSLCILVLDECGLQRFVLGRLCPPDTRLIATTSFEEALRIVRDEPPDAAVVSMPPAELPWSAFQRLCAQACPPVPVLYESCVYESLGEAGLEPLEGSAALLRKPASPDDLRAALARLLAANGRAGCAPSPPREVGDFTHRRV